MKNYSFGKSTGKGTQLKKLSIIVYGYRDLNAGKNFSIKGAASLIEIVHRYNGLLKGFTKINKIVKL